MIRDNIDKLNKLITDKIIHVRASNLVPDTKGMEQHNAILAEVSAEEDLLQMGFNEFKDKITVYTEDYNGFAPPRYSNKSKHIDFYVMDSSQWGEFMNNLKEIVKEVLRNE